MNLLSKSAIKTFNLLSIGQRGVGKTVFLAGCYAELNFNNQKNDFDDLWFDCQDSQEQENLEKILSYVARSGQYPPPTMKISNFNFTLKQRKPWGVTTLCHFHWWDIPGEVCNSSNPDFQKMVLTSHGCCVFIDANALVHNQAYLKELEDIVKQVVAIASLVNQHKLKYAFALIFTKCDLLQPSPVHLLQIEKNLQPLITGLNAVKANYQRFYSTVPIVSGEGVLTLKPQGAATALLWLILELRKLNNFQPRLALADGLTQSLSKSPNKASTVKKLLSPNLLPNTRSYILLALAGFGLLGVIASFLFSSSLFTLSSEQAQAPDKQIRNYQRILQREPSNFDALIHLANLRIQRGQIDQAVPLLEKLVQQKPENLDLRFNLAKLYELTDKKQKAEAAYDQILVQHKNNVTALIRKALLRSEQGDVKTAKVLFVKAETAAPSNFKAKIREIAENSLPSTAKP